MSEYDHILRQALALDPTIIPAIKTETEIQQQESRMYRRPEVPTETVMIDGVKLPVTTHRIEVLYGEFLDVQVVGGK